MSIEQNTEVKQSVYDVMRRILNFLNSPQEHKSRSGYLAAIRNSMGKNFEDCTDVWPVLFPLIPQNFLNVGSLSYEEKALLVALQLYAVGQQGLNKVANDEKILVLDVPCRESRMVIQYLWTEDLIRCSQLQHLMNLCIT